MDSPTCSLPSTSAQTASIDRTGFPPGFNAHCVQRLSCFDLLPENTIKEIYTNLNYKDVLRSHRVCTRFRNVLQRNAHYLSRPRIFELSVKMGLVERRNRPIGRLQIPTSVCSKKMQRRLNITYMRKRQSTHCQKEFVEKENFDGDQYEMSSNFLGCLDEHLKRLTVDGRLAFTGVAIDNKLYERLIQKWVQISDASSLFFTLCRFRLDGKYFRNMLMRTNCRKLNMELSHFDDQVLNDNVLEGMSECIEFSASGTYPKYFPHLTDRILNHWATQKTLPKRIFLHNVYGNFTLEGILTLINALYVKYEKCANDEKCLQEHKHEWNFGCVSYFGESDSLLEMLSLPGHVLHTTNCDYMPNTIDVTLTSKSALHNISNSCSKCSPIIQFQLGLNRIKTN